MRLTNKLLGYLNRVFNKDPMQFLALRVNCDSGQMTWSVFDGFMTLTPINSKFAQPMTLDLSLFTVQSLAQFISSQVGYAAISPFVSTSSINWTADSSVVTADSQATADAVAFQITSSSSNRNLSALVLLDASGDVRQSNGDHLFGYTSFLYSYLNAAASQLEIAQAQIVNALEQMSTTTAESEFLDFLGTFYFVPRNSVGAAQEADPSYSPRIISNVLLPSSNNIGMAIALEAQFPGTQVVVVDAINNGGTLLLRDGSIFFNSEFVHNSNATQLTDGLFDVTFSFDFSGSVSPSEYAPLVIAAVNKYRLGGTYVRNLFLKNGLSASVPITNFTLNGILVTVLDQAVVPIELLTTESGQDITTESGTDIQI